MSNSKQGKGVQLTRASPILSLLPWYTAMSESVEVWDIESPFQAFIQKLRSYESVLLGTTVTTRLATDMQRLLTVGPYTGSSSQVIGPGSQLIYRENPNVAEWSRLCGLISAYRLLDVIILIDGRAPRALDSVQRPRGGDEKILHGMDKLRDWPSVLLDFRKMARKATTRTKPLLIGNTKNAIRLLHMIARNGVLKNYSKVEANFLHAAMHIACMNDLTFTREAYPDLPEKLVEVLDSRFFTAEEREGVDHLVEFLQKKDLSSGLAALRAPLQLSLLISPIFLLLPNQLVKDSFNRQLMISTSIMLGNAKTDLILEVEKAIWKVVFDLASGTLEPNKLLFRLEEDFPWPKIESEARSENERSWFQLDKPYFHPNGVSRIPPLALSTDELLTSMQVDSSPSDLHPSSQASSQDARSLHSADHSGGVLASVPGIADAGDPLDPTLMQIDNFPSDAPGLLQAPAQNAGFQTSSNNMPNDHDPLDEDFLSSILGDSSTTGGDETADLVEIIEDQESEAERNLETEDDASDMDDGMDSPSASATRPESKNKPKRFNPQPRGEAASPVIPKVTKPRKRRRAESSPSLENDEDEHRDRDAFFGPGTSLNPIDIDLYSFWEPTIKEEFIEIEEISLPKDRNPPKVPCDKVLEAFDAEGNKHEFRPRFHYADYNDRLKKFFACIQKTHDLNGDPLHIASPSRSGFAILRYTDFKDMSLPELHKLLRRKNVVVTGCPDPVLGFDEAGLRTLSPLDSQVSIQDYTCPPMRKGDFSVPETLSGLVSDILENAQDPNGKILNGLEFPMWNDSPKDRSAYAVDVVAFDYVRGKPNCGNPAYPTGHMRWGLAGTANTVTFAHMDSDGLATFVQVMVGKKVWGIYCETPELPVCSVNTFLHQNFMLDDLVNGANYGFEAIVLRPGDLLFMHPGLPHFVYGPENTICHGGHFYATCLMQKTLQGLVHSFVIGDFITNITHYPSRLLLRRIMLLYGLGLLEKRIKITDPEYLHLPDVQTFDGLLDLLSASILAILGNVLDFRTYSAPDQQKDEEASTSQRLLMEKFDYNNIPSNERQAICHARGVALSIFDWVRKACIIKDANGQVVEDLPSRFLVQILKSLLNYKAKAIQADLLGAPHCDWDRLKAQAENMLECDTLAKKLWRNRQHIRDDSLAFGPKLGYSVEWAAPVRGNQAAPSYDKRGLTPFDVKFWKGRLMHHQK